MKQQSQKLSPWWTPSRHADRRPFLVARCRIQAAIRDWFTKAGFIEVDTACLQISPGNEAHLHAFKTEAIGTDLRRSPFYLHTSPEFAMKKLLAAGETKIFSFAHAFRNRERGALHSPEFTMLEWYRANEPYERVMDDAVALLALAAQTTGQRLVSWRGRTCDPLAPADRLAVADAFRRNAGLDLLATLSPTGPDRERLAAEVSSAGITARAQDSWSDLFSRALAALVEPRLGIGEPSLLTEYPACESALARPLLRDPRLAERFELYCCGVELANGFGELKDPALQRANLEGQMALKEALYGERYPIDEAFLTALADMPDASGCAMGFDRLVMLAAGATEIDQVIWTPLPTTGLE